jgi:hypothetical protein
MSDKECRKTCEVYADWLKAGEMITDLQAQLAQHEAWYGSLMEHCVKGYYKCEKCGGPVRERLCCAWCETTTPDVSTPKEDAKKEYKNPVKGLKIKLYSVSDGNPPCPEPEAEVCECDAPASGMCGVCLECELPIQESEGE